MTCYKIKKKIAGIKPDLKKREEMAQVTPLSPTGAKLELIPTDVMDHLLGHLKGYSYVFEF